MLRETSASRHASPLLLTSPSLHYVESQIWALPHLAARLQNSLSQETLKTSQAEHVAFLAICTKNWYFRYILLLLALPPPLVLLLPVLPLVGNLPLNQT